MKDRPEQQRTAAYEGQGEGIGQHGGSSWGELASPGAWLGRVDIHFAHTLTLRGVAVKGFRCRLGEGEGLPTVVTGIRMAGHTDGPAQGWEGPQARTVPVVVLFFKTVLKAYIQEGVSVAELIRCME